VVRKQSNIETASLEMMKLFTMFIRLTIATYFGKGYVKAVANINNANREEEDFIYLFYKSTGADLAQDQPTSSKDHAMCEFSCGKLHMKSPSGPPTLCCLSQFPLRALMGSS
jgi:hypothetical protein